MTRGQCDQGTGLVARGYCAECCRPSPRIPISTRSHLRCDCFLVRALPQGGRRGRTRDQGSVGAYVYGAHVWAQERNGALGWREGGRRSPREDARGGRAKSGRREATTFRATCGSAQRKPPRPPQAPPTRTQHAPAPAQAQVRPTPLPARQVAADSSQATCGSPPGAQIFSAISLGPQSPCCAAT